jgi:hypothetical protein
MNESKLGPETNEAMTSDLSKPSASSMPMIRDVTPSSFATA